tara:strand:+ start:3671 stop:4108 length:438 start_codon:yes stop_codon:yes gene_type:complete
MLNLLHKLIQKEVQMENLKQLKEAVLKREELKQDAHYKKIDSLIRQCDEVIRAFTNEQKEILKPLVRFTNNGIAISETQRNKISQKYGIELVSDKTKSTNRFAVHNQIGNSENVKYYLSKRKPTKVPTLTASGFAIYHDSDKSIF